jgi:hypothetical protein
VGVGDVGVVEYGEVGECGRGVFCVDGVGMGLQKDFSNTLAKGEGVRKKKIPYVPDG